MRDIYCSQYNILCYFTVLSPAVIYYVISLCCLLQYDAGRLSNVIKVESLHSTLREDETVYWCRYLINSIRSLLPSLLPSDNTLDG